ncbi:unnamed protein product [Xylocopa violacea]|uniref:Uncharacterized protein n=1 Tax=Xylocopa violacea TaxID=135666 RepID=A0ABP1N9B9_XYLVO
MEPQSDRKFAIFLRNSDFTFAHQFCALASTARRHTQVSFHWITVLQTTVVRCVRHSNARLLDDASPRRAIALFGENPSDGIFQCVPKMRNPRGASVEVSPRDPSSSSSSSWMIDVASFAEIRTIFLDDSLSQRASFRRAPFAFLLAEKEMFGRVASRKIKSPFRFLLLLQRRLRDLAARGRASAIGRAKRLKRSVYRRYYRLVSIGLVANGFARGLAPLKMSRTGFTSFGAIVESPRMGEEVSSCEQIFQVRSGVGCSF